MAKVEYRLRVSKKEYERIKTASSRHRVPISQIACRALRWRDRVQPTLSPPEETTTGGHIIAPFVHEWMIDDMKPKTVRAALMAYLDVHDTGEAPSFFEPAKIEGVDYIVESV